MNALASCAGNDFEGRSPYCQGSCLAPDKLLSKTYDRRIPETLGHTGVAGAKQDANKV